MKDGRTHLAHTAEHAVDLETGAIVGVTVQDADRLAASGIAEVRGAIWGIRSDTAPLCRSLIAVGASRFACCHLYETGGMRRVHRSTLLAVLCPLRLGGERGRGQMRRVVGETGDRSIRTPRFGVSHLVSHRGDSRARSPLGGHPRARVRLGRPRRRRDALPPQRHRPLAPPGCARCRCDGQWLRVSHMIRYRGAVRVRRSFGGHPRARVRTGGYPCQPVSADFAVTASRRGDGAATRPTHTPRPISTTAVGVVASLECGTGPGRSDR